MGGVQHLDICVADLDTNEHEGGCDEAWCYQGMVDALVHGLMDTGLVVRPGGALLLPGGCLTHHVSEGIVGLAVTEERP